MMKKKILIVEDEPSLLKILRDKFKDEGFEVFEAMNGIEGLEGALKNKPDLILLDIVMPRMDGMTMLKKLRQDSWGKGVSVMVLTNLSNSREIEEAVKNGVFDYLVKTDWKLDSVVSKVKQSLSLS